MFLNDIDRRSMIRIGLISAASVLINGKAFAFRRMIPAKSGTPETIPQEIIVPKFIKPEEKLEQSIYDTESMFERVLDRKR